MEMQASSENKKTVLLVEDDVFISDIYQVKMHGEGLDVAVATNGAEAIAYLETHPSPDLVLLDIIMPVMDGMDFLKKAKSNENWKKIPVILLTNLSDKAQVEECFRLGANDYLIKSHCTPSEVMRKVYALLNRA